MHCASACHRDNKDAGVDVDSRLRPESESSDHVMRMLLLSSKRFTAVDIDINIVELSLASSQSAAFVFIFPIAS